MGQKVHPLGFRLGVIRTWDAKWYARKEYGELLYEDLKLRKFMKSQLEHAGISKIEIRRSVDRNKKVTIDIFAARPGIIIGKKGADVDKLRKSLEKMTGKEVNLNIKEVKRIELDAQLVAENVATQLVRRVAFRRAMKRSVSSAIKFGAKGIKIACAGRLGGAEMARREWYREGRVPLQTLRADIDYGFTEARTTYGIIGVKVWIYKGDIYT
ncbi:MAG: 30S ribosomal protein S3 [Deltaproteobacteria bacterium]|nr:30S ribosomal protein S3 [Deltaproteobacteria bacterium]